MKRWLLFCFTAVVIGSITTAYFSLQPVRQLFDRIATTFGLAPAADGVTYWCPMHPEIDRKNPGTCPV